MSVAKNPLFQLTKRDANHLILTSAEGFVAHLFVLEDDIIRVLLQRGASLRQPSSWALCPGGEDLAPEGRDRFDLSGFTLPAYQLSEEDGLLSVETARLRLAIELDGLRCRWQERSVEGWRELARDRPTQAYNFGWWGEKITHYLTRSRDEMYFGLGERSGDSNRAGNSYRMCNIDAMGYDAKTSDPLYKHIPFYITYNTAQKSSFGIYYDNQSDCYFDMGKEIDNYHGPYRYFAAEHGDLDFYVIAGDNAAAITRRFTWLTGRPAFMPKWSLGYSGSTMSYTDAPDAQNQMTKFLERCAAFDMPCQSFHLSSGYGSIGGKRYVFHWNREKFPDPAGFAAAYRAKGVALVANIKPCLLRSHPLYDAVAAQGLFLRNPDGSPHLVQFWDEVGSYLDFTFPPTRAWWAEQVTTALLDNGIAATWNDNNEFEIWDPDTQAAGLASGLPALAAKPVQTMLMMQTSRRAQQAHTPELRPFLVTRSGMAGLQRYAQTWSGDNFTAWATLKYNIRMGTGLALCGISNIGHDIGGFAGPAPSPELLLRWVQFGVFLPRFSIHSWNDDGTVNEPWMYPEIIPEITALLKFRQTLIPTLYHLAWRYHDAFEPMLRPTFYDFPEDQKCYEENDEMMLGPNILVAAVVAPDQTERALYLPAGSDWVDYATLETHAGGQTITIPAPLDRPCFLVRAGSAIALDLSEPHFGQRSEQLGFAIFPYQAAGRIIAEYCDDDGSAVVDDRATIPLWRLTVDCYSDHLTIILERSGARPPLSSDITLLVPGRDQRPVTLVGGRVTGQRPAGDWRRLEVEFNQ